jgi:NAD(P)H-dependent flavin oxidoreductase YrpB (nitropropane dioxygenase family)
MFKIIQGGMGVGISGWPLAKAVSMSGQLGTVSGVVVEKIFARMLQNGDLDGHLRRALSHFPFQEHVERVMKKFFIEGGKPEGANFKATPAFHIYPSSLLISLTICANFALVWLAKEGHDNPVSINYLEKVAMSHVYSITGAMLAGVDFITMGAGIPLKIPDVIDAIAENGTASYRVPIVGIGKNVRSHTINFNPEIFFGDKLPTMKKPGFIPIVASSALAGILAEELSGRIFGFVVEEPTAGGHNAPPRGKNKKVYGPKDEVVYSKIANLGLPFWIGGSKASPEGLESALKVGASGIQVGSIFALCEESGMDPKIRKEICKLGFEGKGKLDIRTDMHFSPTGFPFKVLNLPGTLSDPEIYKNRIRKCDQGGLITLFEKQDGSIGYRCPAESVKVFISKGGDETDTVDRGCLCNGLISTAGLGEKDEPPIITLGDDVSFLPFLMTDKNSPIYVKKVLSYLLGPPLILV